MNKNIRGTIAFISTIFCLIGFIGTMNSFASPNQEAKPFQTLLGTMTIVSGLAGYVLISTDL